jgi:acetyltransferase-like isoleucine patch superfamily enzyme
MLFIDIINKIKYDLQSDRIGPDIPFTHWKLYFKKTMHNFCERKFKRFTDSTEIRPGAYIMGCSRIELGKGVILRPNCMLFGESCSLSVSIKIEDYVMLGAGVHIYINNHRYDNVEIPIYHQGYYPDKAVIIRKGSWIGANTIILPGVIIGENSVVGAGSVVTKSIPDNVVAVGNPARVIKVIK